MSEVKKSPWLYLGCGCGCLVLLVVGAIILSGIAAVHSAKDWVEDLEDPAKQAEKARQLLGTEELPPGYRAHFTLSVPWLMDMTILSSGEQATEVAAGDPANNLDLESLRLGERAFIFVSLRASAKDRRELTEYLAGELHNAEVLEKIEFGIRGGEVLRRGTFELDGRPLNYAAFRGELDHDDDGSDGIFSMSSIECDQQRVYITLWFEKLAASVLEAGPEQADLSGTTADPAAIERFLANFDLCSTNAG